jgi:hypothetical protein
MPATVRRRAALVVAVTVLTACAPTQVRRDPAGDLRAYDDCAVAAAPWSKVREEVEAFQREGVPLAVALDALLITAQTAAGERVLIPTDAIVEALSRHAWRTSSINPLQDWSTRDERGPLLVLRRCLADRYGYRFATPSPR